MELREQLQATLDDSPNREGLAPTSRAGAARRKRDGWQIIGTGVTVAAVFGLAVFASRRMDEQARAKADQNPAIAVLPFENVGQKEGQDFADGMTEEITNRLSSLHGLRVIGRHSAKGYVNTDKTPQQIARELGVKYVLTGTVRWDKSADGKVLVRVSPALLKAEDATQIWAEAYQTVLSGMFDVQSKVATEVADALNVSLLVPERVALTAKPTSSLEAYALYARARQILVGNFQVGPTREAASLLRRATEIDPRFTAAWAMLAVAQTEWYWNGGDKSSNRLALARAALERATAIDSDDPDVHLARGIYQYHGERNYQRAIAEFDAVERARPSDPNAPLYKAAIKRRQGRYEEAIVELKRAVDLDPRNGPNLLEVGNTLSILRRYREAEVYIDRGLILNPEEPLGPILKSALAIDERGNVPEAVEHLRNGARTVQPQSSVIGMLQAQTWPAVEDLSLRQMLTGASATSDISMSAFHAAKAVLYRYLGDLSRARAYADSAAAATDSELKEAADSADLYHRLGFVEALRGRRAEAFRALARADDLLPESVDSWKAADRANTRARMLVILGDSDAAIAALRQRIVQPGGFSANLVRLDPMFASLRADPRFQQLIYR
jgi:TolB-like protein/Tfp pilus assembly protein PilF